MEVLKQAHSKGRERRLKSSSRSLKIWEVKKKEKEKDEQSRVNISSFVWLLTGTSSTRFKQNKTQQALGKEEQQRVLAGTGRQKPLPLGQQRRATPAVLQQEAQTLDNHSVVEQKRKLPGVSFREEQKSDIPRPRAKSWVIGNSVEGKH